MKWGVVLVAIVKDEAPYIVDWVIHHLSLGAEHFFVYDNGSSDGTPRLLDKFIGAGLVTLIGWPVRSGQIDAYNHALTLLRHNAEWVGFFDIDEFVVLHTHEALAPFLAKAEADQILLPWQNFPYGGHFDRPGGTDAENYFWHYKTTADTLVQVKHFVRPLRVKHATAHFSHLIDGKTIVADGTPTAPTHAIAGPSYAGAQLNHYATRSFVENTARIAKGQVSGRSEKQVAAFHRLTEPAAASLGYDDSILRHFNRFCVERGRWQSRSDRPHRFGLGQRSKILYSSNPLYYFLLKSYGNFLAGLSEIGHVTSTPLISTDRHGNAIELSRIWNDIVGRAVYFRVGDTGFQKYFVGSIHYGDFCRRFGFAAVFIERTQSTGHVYTIGRTWESGCPLCLFDVASPSPVSIRLDWTTADLRQDREDVTLPPGRHAGFIYVPDYAALGRDVSLTVTGPPATLHEIVVGALP